MSDATRFRESRTAQQLADALRSGYRARQHELPDSDELTAHVRRLGDIESIPAVAKPGPASVPMKAARAVLRVLLRPWLAVQTQVNHELSRQVQRIASATADLGRRTPQLERSLQKIEQRLSALEQPGASREPRTSAGDSFESLVGLFVQMHLGAPPARVLLVGGSDSLADELTTFGFAVSRSEEFRGSSGSFDVVALLPGAGEASPAAAMGEAARVLRPGGLLLAAWRGADTFRALHTGLPAGLTIASLLVADQGRGAWRVRPVDPGDSTVVSLAESAAVLLCARVAGVDADAARR
jgi:hypothetical protein